MAQKTIVQLVDDLDNVELNGDGKTVTFGFEAAQYEIDLSNSNAQKLHDALAPFIAAARRINGRSTQSTKTAAASDPSLLPAIRQWAKDQGMNISDRGRISKEVQDAYHKAH